MPLRSFAGREEAATFAREGWPLMGMWPRSYLVIVERDPSVTMELRISCEGRGMTVARTLRSGMEGWRGMPAFRERPSGSWRRVVVVYPRRRIDRTGNA